MAKTKLPRWKTPCRVLLGTGVTCGRKGIVRSDRNGVPHEKGRWRCGKHQHWALGAHDRDVKRESVRGMIMRLKKILADPKHHYLFDEHLMPLFKEYIKNNKREIKKRKVEKPHVVRDFNSVSKSDAVKECISCGPDYNQMLPDELHLYCDKCLRRRTKNGSCDLCYASQYVKEIWNPVLKNVDRIIFCKRCEQNLYCVSCGILNDRPHSSCEGCETEQAAVV